MDQLHGFINIGGRSVMQVFQANSDLLGFLMFLFKRQPIQPVDRFQNGGIFDLYSLKISRLFRGEVS